jgi:2-polyprenyl-6-methoxyphenol hydroxylase-like FAD-dependent oxidoreductase
MRHEIVALIQDGETIRGVEARTPEGTVEIRADLVAGCDGRHSTVRQAAQLRSREFGVPIDVLWFRISRERDDPEQLFGTINYGKVLILIGRATTLRPD